MYKRQPWFRDYVAIEFLGVGNPKALKGRTLDFVIADELAFYSEDILTEHLEPKVDDTDGKMLLTSTINGRNHYAMLMDAYRQLEDEGSTQVAEIRFDAFTSQARSTDWIREKVKRYKLMGKMHVFMKEYMLNRDAYAFGEAPFAQHVGSLRIKNDTHPLGSAVIPYVNVSVDLGKPGNNPAWSWRFLPRSKDIHIFEYVDKYDNLTLIDYLWEQHRNRRINIIYPHDVMHPSVKDGKVHLDEFRDYALKRGYHNIHMYSIPKPQNRKALIQEGLQNLVRCKFDLNRCVNGLDHLSKIRFKAVEEDLDTGKFVRNGSQHAADAYSYIWSAIINQIVSGQDIRRD